MTKAIIELAREAGFEVDVYPEPGLHLRLERFAALVRADEREECVKLFESVQKDSTVPSVYFSLSDTAKIIRARSAND